jgi:hypothetical protein
MYISGVMHNVSILRSLRSGSQRYREAHLELRLKIYTWPSTPPRLASNAIYTRKKLPLNEVPVTGPSTAQTCVSARPTPTTGTESSRRSGPGKSSPTHTRCTRSSPVRHIDPY